MNEIAALGRSRKGGVESAPRSERNIQNMNTIGFLLYDNAEELDIVGPWEMFTVWSERFGGPSKCLTISKGGATVTCAKGMKLEPDCGFSDCPDLDVIIIPGGKGSRGVVADPVIMDFVRTQSDLCQAILSVCTGSFILLNAGLLDGLSATTYWSLLDELRKGNRCEVLEDRYVSNRLGQKQIWTSAGVSAGIDMSLRFISENAGEKVAGQVQFYAEYYPELKVYGEPHVRENAPKYIVDAANSARS